MCDDTGERLFMWANTIYGQDGKHRTPYMTRWMFGWLRVHLFHRGDLDPDCHDHSWDFVTFPLTPYLEEVRDASTGALSFSVVPSLRLSYRKAEHAHRVVGPVRPGIHGDGQVYLIDGLYWTLTSGPIWTVVLRGKARRLWGFWRDGQWVDWRSYLFGSAHTG